MQFTIGRGRAEEAKMNGPGKQLGIASKQAERSEVVNFFKKNVQLVNLCRRAVVYVLLPAGEQLAASLIYPAGRPCGISTTLMAGRHGDKGGHVLVVLHGMGQPPSLHY